MNASRLLLWAALTVLLIAAGIQTALSICSTQVASLAVASNNTSCLTDVCTTTGLASGTAIGTFTATMSPPTPTFTYTTHNISLSVAGATCNTTNGSGNGAFQIVNDTLETNGALSAGTYNICVNAIQSGASAAQHAFVVTVGNRIDAAASYCAANGGGNGTAGSPWKDTCILAALNAAVNGDTVFLAAGNWQLDITKATATGNISTSTATITSMSTVTGIVVGQSVGDITILPPDSGQTNRNLPGDPGQNIPPPTVTGINTGGCSLQPCVTLSANPSVTATGDTFGFGYPVIVNNKVITLTGAGSGNTVDALGHPNNGKGNPGGTYTRVYPNGTPFQFPGDFIQFENTTATPGPTVSHIFFDGGASIVSNQSDGIADFAETINFVRSNNPTINDIRVLNYQNSPNAQYFIFGDSSHGSTTTKNSVIQQAIASPGNYTTGIIFQEQEHNIANVDNNIFYQGVYNGFFMDNVTFTRNSVYTFNDGTGNSTVVGMQGNSGINSGSPVGNYHYYARNNLLYSPGNGFGIGGGVNDPNSNGVIADQQWSGDWLIGSYAWSGSCVWRWYDVALSKNFCSPTNAVGSSAMQISNTRRDGITNGMSYKNVSIIGSSFAVLDFQENGCPANGSPNIGTGPVCVGSTENIMQCINCTAQNVYLSGPGNEYLTDANSVSPSQTNTYCNGSTFSGCNTTGFTQAPTVSFTLGNLYQAGGTYYVPFLTESFTAQYGAVEWYASTSATCPANTSTVWSSNNTNFPAGQLNTYVPPVTLSGVIHGNTVYMCVMDHAGNGTATGNHVSTVASQVIP